MKKAGFVLLGMCTTVATMSAGPEKPVSIPDRVKGAETIVVARVIEVASAFEVNEFGDRLIVSHTMLQVEETLKGSAPQIVPLDVEGGTVGGLTLRVSDMEPIAQGDRGVFFMIRGRTGTNVPHLRRNGIVKLNPANQVLGSNLTLDEVKSQVQQGLK